jgi:cupin 2 domain-containing protein
MKNKNIFNDMPAEIPEELIQEIFASGNIRIERIISKGHSSPEDFWYDQKENEWVMVLRGRARLQFFDDSTPIDLNDGDYLNIPSHKKHRIEWTDPDIETVWLAVFY